MKFCPTSSPPLWCKTPYLFVDKWHQTIVTSLWLNMKICIQTIPKTPKKYEVRCIIKIRLLQLKTYAPWLAYSFFSNSLLVHKNTIEICHCVLHKKCHDNFLELLCGDSLRIIVFKLLTFLGLHWWSVLLAKHFYSPSFVHGWKWAIQRFRG
jgi:hypothetical protein